LVEPDLPQRRAEPPVVQAIVRALLHQQALKIRYFSAHSDHPDWRSISPRALASDGLRLHLRAFCHESSTFKDFNLGRIQATAEPFPCPHPDRIDEDWINFATLRIAPHPDLPPHARQALEYDYAMQDGTCAINTRRAMILYTARRLGFLWDETKTLPIPNEIRQLMLLEISN
jgi:predicted DNA-binding transcriptional regulator YafY